MIIYICGWIFFSVFLLLRSWKHKRFFFLLGTTIFVYCMFGLRSFEVGSDTPAYIRYFELYKEYSLKELIFGTYWFKNMEIGYVFICKIVLFFTQKPEIFIKVIAIIITALFVSFLNKLDDNELYWCAFTYYGLYMLCTGLNIMRQCIAMLIVMHIYISYREGKLKKAIVMSCIAFSIHMSSILASMLLIPFVFFKGDIKHTKLLKWILIVGALLFCFLYKYVFQWFGISGYLNFNAEIGVMILFVMCYFYILLWLSKSAYLQNDKIDTYIFLETNIIILIIMNFMSVISPVFTRLTTLLIVFASFVPCNIQKSKLNYNWKLGLNFSTYFLISMYFLRSLISNTGGIVPFEFM